jgi:HK97 gp10 family phage protein
MAGSTIHVQIVVKKNQFPACPGIMAKAIATAFGQLGPELLTQMQERTPVDTGELRDSEAASVGAKELRLTAGTDHCVYVEFGTRKMAAQPYMRPTIEGAAGQVGGAISSAASAAFGAL